MLLSMGLQKVGCDLVTEHTQNPQTFWSTVPVFEMDRAQMPDRLMKHSVDFKAWLLNHHQPLSLPC